MAKPAASKTATLGSNPNAPAIRRYATTETIDPRFHPRLRVDERIIPFSDGAIWRVHAVTECAAYIREESGGAGKVISIPGKTPFLAASSGRRTEISPNAFVERVKSLDSRDVRE